MKVLIVEDDKISRQILEQAVCALGHQALVAVDGLQAWETFRQEPVDAIISDWIMPGMTGLDLCRQVRLFQSKSAEQYTYFIFLTALDDQEHLVDAMRAGADDYLGKPLNVTLLEAQLNVAQRFTTLYRQVTSQRGELQRLNHQLHQQARIDPLTNLGNRLRLNEDLSILQGQVDRYDLSYSFLIADVDYFKPYNDTYGHLAGDAALRQVAGTLDGTRRQGDSAYRYGGEEFLVLLPEQTLEAATIAAERFRRAVTDLRIEHRAGPESGVLTVSVGVAELSAGTTRTIEETLKRADDALYQAKQAGRNRVVGWILHKDGAPA